MRSTFVTAMFLMLTGWPAVSFCATDSRDGNPVDIAREKLLAVLLVAHPGVAEWTITPLTKSTSDRESETGSIGTVEVLSTGTRSAVRLEWTRQDAPRRSRILWFDVVGKQPIVVAARDLPAGAAFDPADVTTASRDVVELACSAVIAEVDVSGMRSKQAMRAGAPICRSAIESRPDVTRGEAVTVHYRSERIALVTNGIAQQDGRVGQRLRVINPSSKDFFFAVVSGIREVTIDE